MIFIVMSDKKNITEAKLRTIIREELINKLRQIREASEPELAAKESHEISAAASALLKAVAAFEEEKLPEVPAELESALSAAKSILNNMSDNPGRYKRGSVCSE